MSAQRLNVDATSEIQSDVPKFVLSLKINFLFTTRQLK